MTPSRLYLVLVVLLVGFPLSRAQGIFAQDSDQQISDFSLAGFGDKGKKTWDLAGRTADIFGDIIKLKDIIGNLYGEDEDIRLTADRGDFNKKDGKVHLEQNVVVTTSSGARLLTEALDWDRKNQTVATSKVVNIAKENIVAVAQGATGKPQLNSVTLEKNVTVNINPGEKEGDGESAEKTKTVITCDGPLYIDYEKNVATFHNNVKVDRGDTQIYSDTMDVYFIASNNAPSAPAEGLADKESGIMGNKIEKIVTKGNTRIVRGENISYSDQAIYTAKDKKITLVGSAKLVIYSTEDLGDAPAGD